MVLRYPSGDAEPRPESNIWTRTVWAGVIPVHAQISKTEWITSLFPKDALYLVPIEESFRKAENLEESSNVAVRLELR